MKVKLLGFLVAIASVATIGLVQLQAEAGAPGQVGNAPRCTISVAGARNSAFKVSGTKATVAFKVTGSKNCKVQANASSWYAPSMSGQPWSKQKLIQRIVKVYTPGNYTATVKLPAKSTKALGCYYQVDLSYGKTNNLPVIAYGHGKLDCSVTPPPKPAAACGALRITNPSKGKYTFAASATTANGATISSYRYAVSRDGTKVYDRTFASKAKTHTVNYNTSQPGTYKVAVYVKTSVGTVGGSGKCVGTFTIKQPPAPNTPGVAINKLVDGVEHKEVGLNTQFTYQIRVTNTGDVNLKNVVVTDTPDAAVTLLEASAGEVSGNKWTYVIPELAIGQHLDFTITAKVPTYKAGIIKNTVCVDAPEVPGNPDDCDDATVEVPPEPGKVKVCDPETGKIIVVSEEDADKYVPVNSPECAPTPETPVVETPEVLPETGITDTVMQLIGLGSLVSASTYYVLSRRNG